ncbi:MAG: NAD(P)/FAD-dependent oxidoreductase [Cyclobacteriaceae bacterium]|nr:NAD(P)/FAD-dependent oxidoreductase [Cyclobacteriaceae bacterium]
MPESYKKTSPNKKYDHIIIGSGISGSGLAAILAKEGQSSLVLERHYTPGGFTHVFKRRGYEWDVGVHYIGQVHQKKSFIRRLFNYITDGQLQWAELSDNYDRIIFGDKSFNFYKGKGNFKNKLKANFQSPEDQKSIDKYVDLIREASGTSRGLFVRRGIPKITDQLFGGLISRKSKEFYSKTTKEVLESFISNPELVGVLTGQFGDYGMPPGESSFIMHAMLVNHYFEGGSYPVGGSSRIFNTIEPTIKSAGGDVFVNAEVNEVLIKNGKAIGVKMIDGKEFYAANIISSIGIHNTYNKLLKGQNVNPAKLRKINKLKYSVAHLCLYIGFKETPEALHLPKTNLWIYPDNYDHDENIRRFLKDPENEEFPVVYVSFPAAKDPDFQNRYPGKSTIEIITLSDYAIFQKWESEEWKKRGQEYEDLKERYSQRLLQKLYEQMPQLKGKVDYYELSTPLSTRHFVNYDHGEIYGLDHSPERFASKEIHVKSPIKNLYLTGQDMVSCGIAGALISSVVTSSVLTGKNMINKIVKSE